MKSKPLENYNPRHVGIRLYKGGGKVQKAVVRPGDSVEDLVDRLWNQRRWK